MEHLLKMNKYVVKTKDKIVEQVIEKIDQRSLVGQKKYGSTMMGDEIEEAMLNRSKHFNDNISNIELDEEEIL